MTARFIVGDVLEVLATLPDDSVDLVFTSPPFLALRSYLPADHTDKAKEIGSEPTPGEFIDALLDVTEACERVLAPHGSLCFELGDTYSGSGGAGGDYTESGLRANAPGFRGSAYAKRYEGANGRSGPGRTKAVRDGWPLDKSLCLVPELFRLSLAYGINPLTGRETPAWRIRNVVRWHRPNPPVGALGDKFRPATSEIVIACKSRSRYFDLDAVREPGSPNTHNRLAERDSRGRGSRPNEGKAAHDERRGGNFSTLKIADSDGTAPPQDTWTIPTAPYKGSHYATFPPALVVRPVLSMCPERVCTTCGEPSRRITAPTAQHADFCGKDMFSEAGRDREIRERSGRSREDGRGNARVSASFDTLGWSDCGHGTWRSGVVLDPFAGSGTTLAVASGHGRDSIGVDIDERNAELARQRVGMFLEVVLPEVVA